MAKFEGKSYFIQLASRIVLRILSVCGLIGLLGLLYWTVERPRQLRWGAAADELQRALPMDDTVTQPAFDATRAITIEGRPQDIWPWLVQMGYGRAGFYGYDLIENPGGGRGVRSAAAILPEFQHPRKGDILPLSAVASLEFGMADPDRALVWIGRERPPRGVFVWALAPVDATHTRLISRIRWQYADGEAGRVLGVFTEFADHVAVRAILRGVRDRVERRRPPSLILQGLEITAWLLAMLEFGGGVLLVIVARHWGTAWLMALGAGLLLQLVLYGPAPAAVNAALPWTYLAGMALVWRRGRPAGKPSAATRLVAS